LEEFANTESKLADIEVRLRSDATRLLGASPCILCHVLSEGLTWGLGFTQAIEMRWPSLATSIAHRLRTLEPRPTLGEVLWTPVDDGLSLAHLIAERRGGPNGMQLDPIALASCLDRVGERARLEKRTVHAPPIGSGLSGARWVDVERVIRTHLVSRGVHVVIHCLGTRIPD
jgi:hypothetical protein